MFEHVMFADGEVCINLDSNSFMVSNIKPLTDVAVVEISKLFVSENSRNDGRGTFMLNSVIEKYKDNSIIVLKAEPIFETEEEYHACTTKDEQISKLVHFYERRGFVNINSFIGYEFGVSMIYNNDAYKKIKNQLV